MKKVLIRTLIIGGCVLVAAYLLLDVFVGGLTKSAFNKYAPPMLQTEAHLDAAALSPLSGRGLFTGLTVVNPKGWSPDNALKIGFVRVKVEPSTLLSSNIVINELTFDTVEFNYQTRVLSSNIGDILKNVKGDNGKNPAPQPSRNGTPTKFVIQTFKITHAKVRFGVGPTAVTLPMEDLTLTNLGNGAGGGVNAAEITTIILRTITTGLAKMSLKGVGTVGGAVGSAAGSAVGGAVDAVKGLFGGSK